MTAPAQDPQAGEGPAYFDIMPAHADQHIWNPIPTEEEEAKRLSAQDAADLRLGRLVRKLQKTFAPSTAVIYLSHLETSCVVPTVDGGESFSADTPEEAIGRAVNRDPSP